MGAGLIVRRAAPEEIGACADLYQQVLRDTFTWLPPERHRREDFLLFARDEEIYVALEDGRIIGVAGFYRPQKFLHSLYVKRRGRGVGKALLDHVRTVAAGRVSLKVQVPNTRALAFYLREGFQQVAAGSDDGVAWLRLVAES